MWVGGLDEMCTLEHALDIRDEIGDAVKYFTTIDQAQHEWFASANNPSFVLDVITQLKTGYDRPETNFVQ